MAFLGTGRGRRGIWKTCKSPQKGRWKASGKQMAEPEHRKEQEAPFALGQTEAECLRKWKWEKIFCSLCCASAAPSQRRSASPAQGAAITPGQLLLKWTLVVCPVTPHPTDTPLGLSEGSTRELPCFQALSSTAIIYFEHHRLGKRLI